MGPARLQRVVGWVAAASRRYDSSSLAVARRVLALRARKIGIEEAYLAGVLDPRVPIEQCADFVGRRELLLALRPFNAGPKDLVDDKAIFAVVAESHGLPVPRTLALVAPPLAVDVTGRPLDDEGAFSRWLREAPPWFLVKPAVGMGGQRIDLYERRGDEVVSRERRMTANELRRRVCVEAVYGRAIVQQRLRNDASLGELSGTDALQCTRMVTVVTRAAEVELLFAFQKLIVGGHLVDNSIGTRTGNLVVSVDLAGGTLGSAFSDGAPCPIHPVTGRTIAGFVLPHWEAARRLVERAALRFRPLRAIGWDVALTPDGPVLVEGNTEWVAFGGDSGFWYSAADFARLRRLY
jgi:hypothetical protein